MVVRRWVQHEVGNRVHEKSVDEQRIAKGKEGRKVVTDDAVIIVNNNNFADALHGEKNDEEGDWKRPRPERGHFMVLYAKSP